MHLTSPMINMTDFVVAGINYKKTDAATRGQFAIHPSQYENILRLAPGYGIEAMFILSTCNRTEIYGMAANVSQLTQLLCTQTTGSETAFNKLAYVKKGYAAVEHLFHVGAGLDSQILGDYEIVGQLKQAVKFAKDRQFINCFLERLVNHVLQVSKLIKNDTELSGGTVSVSFAAVQYIKDNVDHIAAKKILLIGTGKIGRNTCKNLVDYLGTTNITLINRTEEKAAALAAELGLHYAPAADLAQHIAASDIILAATNAGEAPILRQHLQNSGDKLIIDLSVPYNVAANARQLPNITLVNVDTLSKIKDEALQKREAEVPKARAMITQHLAEFMDWQQMRKNAPLLGAIKTMLKEIALLHQREFDNAETRCPYIAAEQKIQQVINGIAGKMRTENLRGCYHLEAINNFIDQSNR